MSDLRDDDETSIDTPPGSRPTGRPEAPSARSPMREAAPPERDNRDTRATAALPAVGGFKIWAILLAGAVGALLTLGLDAWLQGRPVPGGAAGGPSAANGPAAGSNGPSPAPDLPADVVDPSAARDLIVATLGGQGVPPQNINHGLYPLRGPGRRPGETFPLVSFACPPGRACADVLQTLEAPLAQVGFQLSRNIGGDRPGRPVFRAVSQDRHPALAIRAYPAGPRLTLVVDDLGREPAVLEKLLALDEHVTFALMPNTPSAPQLAARLADAGREIVAHLPLEPQPPAEPDGPDFLTTTESPEEAARGAERLLDRLPGASGANNHLGGRFTTSPAHMAALLNVLKARSMFFVDDRTSPASVALATAKVIGVRSAARTHSLDLPDQDVRAAFKAVEAALVLDGQAVVVAHGDPATLAALAPWLDDLKRRNIHLFRLSEVVL